MTMATWVKMARGVCEGLHLTSGDRNAIRDQVLYVSERAHTGLKFLTAVVAPLLEKPSTGYFAT
jgi:hypothetical protein